MPTHATQALPATSTCKWWVVTMLWLISFFNYADRQAIFSVFPLLEREMNLTPVQLGLLGSAFAWVYGLGAPLAGMIVDRVRPMQIPEAPASTRKSTSRSKVAKSIRPSSWTGVATAANSPAIAPDRTGSFRSSRTTRAGRPA